MKIAECKMKQTIEQILEAHELLEAFNSSHFYAVKILNPPYMPLSIDRRKNRVSVTHYYEQNGDLVPDPDMDFHILESGKWIPHAIQHASGFYQVASEITEDGLRVKPKAITDQIKFANFWAKNLIAQGFKKGTVLSKKQQ